MALNTIDSCLVGRRPFSSRNATSPRDTLPSSSSARSWPRTTTRSVVDHARSDRSCFRRLPLTYAPTGPSGHLPGERGGKSWSWTVDRQPGLVAAFAKGRLGDQRDLTSKHELGVDRLGDLGRQGLIGNMAVRDLDLDRHGRRDADLPPEANDPSPAGDARAKVADDRENRARIHIHPSHDEHVVATANHPHAEGGPLAFARGSLDAHDIRAAEPHHRHRLTGQARVHELTDGSGLDFHRFESLWVD